MAASKKQNETFACARLIFQISDACTTHTQHFITKKKKKNTSKNELILIILSF